MKKLLVLTTVLALLLIGACKKQETKTEDIAPYKSIKSNGDKATKILVVILGGDTSAVCNGVFLEMQSNSDVQDQGIDMLKVIGEVPDSIIRNANYGNTQWLVDLVYQGVGIECYISAQLSDPMPNGKVYSDDIELVKVTNYERYP